VKVVREVTGTRSLSMIVPGFRDRKVIKKQTYEGVSQGRNAEMWIQVDLANIKIDQDYFLEFFIKYDKII
jgi:hypothetical protein